MPGAANGVLDEEPLGERAAVMRAGGADREHLLAASCQQHRLVADMAEQHGAVGELSEGDALGEIGPAWLRLSFAHESILLELPSWFTGRLCREVAKRDLFAATPQGLRREKDSA